jgi:hypothetical protein
VHTFGVTLVTAGPQTVTAKDTATSINGTGTLTVIGAAKHFSVTAPPTVTTGVPFSITVTALDALDAIDTAYAGTVHFKTSDAGAGVVLPGDYTFVGADSGVHTFSVTLVTLGIQTVTATDTADESITGTSNDILVVAPTATVTPSSTPSTTPTASASPTRTPVPQGGGCSDPAQCAGGLFCSQGVCCDAPCTGQGQSCAVPGQRGDCVSTVPAEAPVLSAGGLVAAVATLIACTAFALVFRRRRDRR